MADGGLIFARFLALALTMTVAGVPLYLRCAGQAIAPRALRAWLAAGALLAAAASIWATMAAIASMAGQPLADLDSATVEAVLAATPLGFALYLRLAAIATCLAALALLSRNLMFAVCGAVALVSSAWTGHAGAGEGAIGTLQRLFDMVHLLAAALWFGALLVFLGSLFRYPCADDLALRLKCFARTGTIVVVLLAITGLFNAFAIARHGFEPTSTWSLLLLGKLCLFATMLGFAALNRWRLAPAHAAGVPGADLRLLLSLSFETACAVAIFLLVAALGLADPAAA